MRTTISIDDYVLDAAKAAARQRRATLGQVVEDALRRELARPTAVAGPELPVFAGGTGAQPGVDLQSNRALTELVDGPEERPVTGAG